MCKRLFGLAGAAILAASSPLNQARAENIPLCFVTFSLQVAYFQSSVAGGKRAAQELGVDPIESKSLMGPIEQAGKQGIAVAVLDTPIKAAPVIANIGVPQYDVSHEFGQFVAGYVIGKMGGKAKVGIMLASTEVQLLRRDGFVDALKAVPGAEIVATGDGRNILE